MKNMLLLWSILGVSTTLGGN